MVKMKTQILIATSAFASEKLHSKLFGSFSLTQSSNCKFVSSSVELIVASHNLRWMCLNSNAVTSELQACFFKYFKILYEQ